MNEREKVIEILEYCLKYGTMGGHDCWLQLDEKGKITNTNARDRCPNKGCETGCVVTPIRDAVALLKAQEPMEPVKDGNGCLICGNQDYGCGAVGTYDVGTGEVIDKYFEYCPHCGKKVKWDA